MSRLSEGLADEVGEKRVFDAGASLPGIEGILAESAMSLLYADAPMESSAAYVSEDRIVFVYAPKHE